MSRSFGKYKTVGVCYGNNTPYYEQKRKKCRRLIKHSIKNTWANTRDPELFDEVYQKPCIKFKDTWDEPTDGGFKLYPNSKKFGKYRKLYKVKGKNRIFK